MPKERASRKAVSHRVFAHGVGKKKTPCRAGLYARVSTHDQQTLPLQHRAMRDYAATRGWTIVVEIKEIGSGASARRILKAKN
jgi:predicted site-specific integrase-resolvase